MATKRKITETAPAVLDESITEETPVKKAPVKREDPIARAERLLEEAKAKAKEAAAKQLTNAEDSLTLAEASLLKALKVHTERRDRVIMLKQRLGEEFQLPTSAAQLLFGVTLDAIYDAQHAAEQDERPTLQELVDAEMPHPLEEVVNEVSDLQDRVDVKAA